MKPKFKGFSFFQIGIFVLALSILFLCFVPIFLMLSLSLKSDVQIYGNFFSLPKPIMWSNYNQAVEKLIPNMINTLIVVSTATFLTVLLSITSGFVFAKMHFPGKNFLYVLILSLMMIPGVLTLVPLYALVQQYGLYNTWWALILPWVASGQVFGLLLCRTFMTALPTELFESAKIDGYNEIKMLFLIAVPLSKPIIATVVVIKMVDFYNDFIWPLLVIETNSKQMITVAIRVFQSSVGKEGVDLGPTIAGFVFATIPLFILFSFTSRLYMEGLTSGAVKG